MVDQAFHRTKHRGFLIRKVMIDIDCGHRMKIERDVPVVHKEGDAPHKHVLGASVQRLEGFRKGL